MSLFKKRVSFPQFVADLICFQCRFLEGNFDKLIALADEMKVLTKEDKEEFLDKADALLMADLTMGCSRHFSAYISQVEVGKGVGFLYEKYLTELKHLPKVEVDRKVESVIRLFDLAQKAEENERGRHAHYNNIGYTSFPRVEDPAKAGQLHLCHGFAEYCTGNDMKAEGWLGRNFAAFKLATAVVTGDIVGRALKEYKVTF
jgi:hypothetical protein